MNRRIARKLVKQAMSGQKVNPHRLQVAVRLIAQRGDSRLDLSPIAAVMQRVVDSLAPVLDALAECSREMSAQASRVLGDLSAALLAPQAGGPDA